MKKPVTKVRLTEKRSDERNVFELVNQLADLANLRAQVRVRGETTGNGVYLPLWSDTVDAGQAFLVSASVIGLHAAGGAWYALDVGYRNNAGTLVAIGAGESRVEREDAAAADARFSVSGDTLTLEVRDDAANAMSWTGFVTAIGVA